LSPRLWPAVLSPLRFPSLRERHAFFPVRLVRTMRAHPARSRFARRWMVSYPDYWDRGVARSASHPAKTSQSRRSARDRRVRGRIVQTLGGFLPLPQVARVSIVRAPWPTAGHIDSSVRNSEFVPPNPIASTGVGEHKSRHIGLRPALCSLLSTFDREAISTFKSGRSAPATAATRRRRTCPNPLMPIRSLRVFFPIKDSRTA